MVPDDWKNQLYFGDNLDILSRFIPEESVDLVYLDPPFNSDRNYNAIFARHNVVDAASAQIQAFEDTWQWTNVTEAQYADLISGGTPSNVSQALIAFRTLLGENSAMAYLVNMAPRLVEFHRALKESGSLLLHCDPTMSHYLKVLLDAIFGANMFRNEIVWHYSGWNKVLPKHFERRHDIILFYAKSDKQKFKSFTMPWASIEEYVRVRKQKVRTDEEGRLYVLSDRGKGHRIKRYLDEALQYGKPIDDVWNIDKINNSSAEGIGYPTQKPIVLLERLISATTEKDDIVLDPFCGCGTTVDASIRLKRRWIGIDVTFIAVDLIRERLRRVHGPKITETYKVTGIPRDFGAAQQLFDNSPFEFERWAVSLVGGTPNKKQVGDKGIDGIASFWLDNSTVGQVIISVKGGRTVGPDAVRDLIGTVTTHQAAMGVLVVLNKPTRGVLDAAHKSGIYTWPVNGQTFPKVQLIDVQDLLKGNRPKLPTPLHPPYSPRRKCSQTAGFLAPRMS